MFYVKNNYTKNKCIILSMIYNLEILLCVA